ncbi:Phage-related protein [Sandaracinus amylolyticus]|uniref:Phage-related protein n=2 Tax=Sandaracinus amylolyticus TaxID=927083 RepID=A0A0F6SEZ3_9BACT|nr:Phage-related protein [Sandaracinus amylolyticus]
MQTRRLVKLRGADCVDERFEADARSPMWPFSPQHDEWITCPYGEPGDRLWVRETWSIATGNGRRVVYRADLGTGRWPPNVLVPSDDAKVWKPSIHMKRADARIVLEVTEIRVERLQAITQDDARAEAVEPTTVSLEDGPIVVDARDKFSMLWDELNGERASWASNPWVWAITFRRVQP